MKPVQPGHAAIFRRPFGPMCVIGCPRQPGRRCNAEVQPSPGAEWENHGTDELPTLTPSYNCEKGCGWHGYVIEGRLANAPKVEPGSASFLHVCANCKHGEIIVVSRPPAPGAAPDPAPAPRRAFDVNGVAISNTEEH